MPRSGAQARLRLQESALDLYQEHGYEATTTAQIAARAGVTERTYFRHFADKREVLFDGEVELRDVMVAAVMEAEQGLAPVPLVLQAYTAAVPLFVAGRPAAERRAALIATSPALQERAHTQASSLSEALVDAMRRRGMPGPTARLAVRSGAAIFERASHSWDGRTTTGLLDLIRDATDELRSLW